MDDKMLFDGLIVDEIGKMGTFYSLSAIVFMGGTLIEHGGHNPIEPIHFKKPVLYGPNMFNFREICHILNNAGAQQVMHKEELSSKLIELFDDRDKRVQIGNQLYQALMEQQQNSAKLIEDLWIDSTISA